ncbi:GTPase-activating protein GYP7 SKDI_04G0140 [Saccharomyces kudriavzevii IFO 1802]|uniref:GTPase-activating protein GYP7 n=1 Tax=Saccharomyces kudriavzevii (strain ATCC MYA-4449 / AS 2.2408 / CBS 8840 / NBRC 1802 / NCYC 2889) TaxID=226230 RepID=A0AA35JEB5_SACK1|nr:uncharacterized protein SKDI_04G0140 [Saccharomyces kudriavzevii IFO 1802]CAI4057015.1 hypothetical protein SKDI_04G0140 [Saccharomyces kudriavzevii IFO 1802]
MSKILLCKSKVFLHPTSDARDNVAGFLLLTLEPNKLSHQTILQYIPESCLSSSELSNLLKHESKVGMCPTSTPFVVENSIDFCNLVNTSSGLAFGISLSQIYCIQFRPPSPNGWYVGSLVIYPLAEQFTGFQPPVLFFHDQLCPSTTDKLKRLRKSMNPFDDSDELYWGGVDLRNRINELMELKKSNLEPEFWLVNPTLNDLRNFVSKDLLESYNNQSKNANGPSTAGVKLNEKLQEWKWNVMSKIADVTTKSTNFIDSWFTNNSALQKSQIDNEYLQKLLNNEKVKQIEQDYDSARVYLANWSLGVKQEAERYQKQNKLFDSYRNNIFNDLNLTDELNDTEINNALQRQFPLTEAKWNSLWDENDGRLRVTVNEVKDFIFHGGLENDSLRREVWGFLLEIYPWDSSKDERLQIDQTLAAEYNQLKLSWSKEFLQFDDEDEEEYWNDQIFRISKDVRRCDRNLDIFQYNTADGLPPLLQELSENNDGSDETAASAGDESDDAEGEIKNPHLVHLQNILITYNVYNTNLGYVQGMTDLLSPVYVIMKEEWKTFWCFSHFMDIMERNFLRDQSGIHEQMLTLMELVQLMLPELSEHLNKCDSGNLFFCFRMLLVWFKREFDMEDIMHIWENFWTFYLSSQFQLFFMLAILQKNSQAILQHLNQFDQILKFFNELNGKLDWNDLMVRAELLFKKFEKMMHVMERDLQNSSSSLSSSAGVLPCQSERLNLLLSKKTIIKHEGKRSKDSVK